MNMNTKEGKKEIAGIYGGKAIAYDCFMVFLHRRAVVRLFVC